MPGIFGFILKNKTCKEDPDILLKNMAQKLQHFDTYRATLFNNHKVGLGKIDVHAKRHRKLYTDAQTGISVSLYGDIYNYSGIDTPFQPNASLPEKIILELYQKYGTNTPEKINGDYNIVINDPAKNTLLIFNDRFGFRHLYMYDDQSIFMFAPEMKAFLAYPAFDKALDEQGISDYFNFSYHMGNRTMFKNVTLLPPASCLQISPDITWLRTYWEPHYTQERGLNDIDESIETGYELFLHSVKRRVADSEHVIVPLSGGLDSRLIAAAAKSLNLKITTATFGIRGCLEHKIAKEVCKSLSLNEPHLVSIKPDWIHECAPAFCLFNECNHSSLGMTTLHGFAQTMGTNYDCFLNGLFGGHLSFGSSYFTMADMLANYSPEERFRRIFRGLNGHGYDRYIKNCATPKLNHIVIRHREKTIQEEWDRTAKSSDQYPLRQDNFFIFNRIRRAMNTIDHNRFFYNDQFPFAGYELYDFYLSLSPELTLNHRLYKEIYKKKLPHLARIPWQNTGVNLFSQPTALHKFSKNLKEAILRRTTQMSRGKINLRDKALYQHLDANYRRNARTRKHIEDTLLDNRCLERNCFARKGLLELFEFERKGGSAFEEISKMFVFETWARDFLD